MFTFTEVWNVAVMLITFGAPVLALSGGLMVGGLVLIRIFTMVKDVLR